MKGGTLVRFIKDLKELKVFKVLREKLLFWTFNGNSLMHLTFAHIANRILTCILHYQGLT